MNLLWSDGGLSDVKEHTWVTPAREAVNLALAFDARARPPYREVPVQTK